VNAVIIRFSLLLLLGAIANFLLAIILQQLTMASLAGQASQLGSMVLIGAFSLFLLSGLAYLSKLIIAAFCDYFSAARRMERNVLFYISQHNRLTRLFYFKKARLLYFNQQQRKRLLKKAAWKSASS
jgi:hypothetical protein